MFINLFQEIEVENLFKALDLCMEYARLDLHVFNVGAYVTCSYSNDEVERIKKLVGIDHNKWEQPCTCDKCKNMCKVPCIGTPKDIEAIIDAGYADRLKETMWMVGYLAVKEKPIAMIQPTEKDGWCAFRQPDGLCELRDRGLKPTEGVLASCKVIEEDDIPTYETSVLRAVAHEWVKVENFGDIMRVVFKFLHENERRK